MADVVAAGWLGTVGERLRARLADVCVLPAPGETVWWRERHRFDMRFRGHHGGLSEDEARTQVAALVVYGHGAGGSLGVLHGALEHGAQRAVVAGLRASAPAIRPRSR